MPNKWIEHCKKYAMDNNVPYRQAMKDSKASYKPMTGNGIVLAKPKKTPKEKVKKQLVDEGLPNVLVDKILNLSGDIHTSREIRQEPMKAFKEAKKRAKKKL